MTYRELVKECCKMPQGKCSMKCKYLKECEAFEHKTDIGFPGILRQVLNFNFDEEIEVE